jgi:small subunit ribosomal protein S7
MRGRKAIKRIALPDPIYNSRVLTKLINKIMLDGKKTIAQSLVYKAMAEIEKSGKNPMTVFDTAMANISPKMEVRPRRVGGASYQVPVEVRGDRKESLAIRWLVDAARKRGNGQYKTFAAKLAAEIQDAANGAGAAVRKKEDTLRMAEANKAFAHFRW